VFLLIHFYEENYFKFMTISSLVDCYKLNNMNIINFIHTNTSIVFNLHKV